MQKALRFDNGLTARGTETEKQRTSRVPNFRKLKRGLTGPALYYFEMLHPCQRTQSSTQLLISELARNISRMARQDGLEIEMTLTYPWAAIIINKHLGRSVSDREATRMLKLSCHRVYQRKYKIREQEVLRLLQGYKEEACI